MMHFFLCVGAVEFVPVPVCTVSGKVFVESGHVLIIHFAANTAVFNSGQMLSGHRRTLFTFC